MKTVSVTEFRSNLKRYLDFAKNEKIIIHRGKGISYALIPLENIANENKILSNSQNQAINEALEDIENGRTQSHEQAMAFLKTKHQKYFK